MLPLDVVLPKLSQQYIKCSFAEILGDRSYQDRFEIIFSSLGHTSEEKVIMDTGFVIWTTKLFLRDLLN